MILNFHLEDRKPIIIELTEKEYEINKKVGIIKNGKIGDFIVVVSERSVFISYQHEGINFLKKGGE